MFEKPLEPPGEADFPPPFSESAFRCVALGQVRDSVLPGQPVE
jgi:hypothetical protein